jgi:two-component system, OmpR family, alkaline phosphatase synthesis response regulator PhoP
MKKILLVDDDPATTLVLDMILTQEGYEVSVVNDSRQTVVMALRTQPDVILLDLMMPVVDGVEACKMLRAVPRFEKTPILFFTAIGDLDYKSAAYQAGADDFLVKPIPPAELLARIKIVSEGRA